MKLKTHNGTFCDGLFDIIYPCTNLNTVSSPNLADVIFQFEITHASLPADLEERRPCRLIRIYLPANV